jgi:hypothetical protein
MSPTFRHGKGTKVFLDAYDLSSMLREVNITAEADVAETSAFGTLDKTYVVGLIGANASLSGMFSGAAGEIDAVLNQFNADDLDHPLTVCPEGVGTAGNGVGRNCTMMPGKVTSRTIPATISDMVGINANVISDGPTREGEILHEFTVAESTGGNSTNVDNGALSTFGMSGHLHVTANTRNGTSVFKIQDSPDNSAWTDRITFTTVGTSTITSERINFAGTVQRHLRGLWTIAGTTGSITFLIAAARNPY